MQQQGDVLLFQTDDDGDIFVSGGLVTMTGGLETAVYLSLFGGNEDGSQWWGNVTETELSKKYISETQNLLLLLPITSANLLRIEDAVKRDLAWIPEGGFAKSIVVSSRIMELNTISLAITVDGVSYEYRLPWGTA